MYVVVKLISLTFCQFRELYWTPKSGDAIYCMKMDGSGKPEILWSNTEGTTVGQVTGIALNYENTPDDILYWIVSSDDPAGTEILKLELNNPEKPIKTVTVFTNRKSSQDLQTFRENIYFRSNFGGVRDQIIKLKAGVDNVVFNRFQAGFTDFAVMHHSLQPGMGVKFLIK